MRKYILMFVLIICHCLVFADEPKKEQEEEYKPIEDLAPIINSFMSSARYSVSVAAPIEHDSSGYKIIVQADEKFYSKDDEDEFIMSCCIATALATRLVEETTTYLHILVDKKYFKIETKYCRKAIPGGKKKADFEIIWDNIQMK